MGQFPMLIPDVRVSETVQKRPTPGASLSNGASLPQQTPGWLGMPEAKQIHGPTTSEGPESRRHFLRILFVHRSLADVERCLHELKRVGFTVTSDVVVTPEQFADRLHSQCFDLILAEYPSSNWQGAQALDCLRLMKKAIPLIYLVYLVKRETVAELILQGASDCIEMDGISHLPVAIHLAQDEVALRDARNRA